MTVTINGTPESLPSGTTIAGLLAARNLSPDKVAIELNKRLVRGANNGYARPLQDNDQLEIVTFVGGG